jgi:4-hydroxybenzoate polyprenyltransferase
MREKMKRPIGVSIIGYFYIFGAVVLLFTAIFYQADADAISISERFGLSILPERMMRIVLAFFSLLMVYGYMRLKKWGFWLFISYSVLFGLISSVIATNQPQQPFIGNVVFSIIVLMYTIYVKEAFFTTVKRSQPI